MNRKPPKFFIKIRFLLKNDYFCFKIQLLIFYNIQNTMFSMDLEPHALIFYDDETDNETDHESDVDTLEQTLAKVIKSPKKRYRRKKNRLTTKKSAV
jgi:hypothetical protein